MSGALVTATGVLDRVKQVLREASLPSVDVEARRLVEAASGRSTSDLILEPDLDPSVEQKAVDFARRRASGEPLQYVIGVAGFRRLDLAVGPGVFVPRPETELVVDKALDRLPRGGTIVDVGTGSGAIALSIADERPDARVLATEHFPSAIEWVKRNRELTAQDVEIIECDLLEGLPDDLRKGIDVVVANPPYVAEPERPSLPVDVGEHEPEGALFGGGQAGMETITRLAHDARAWLRPGGWLVSEIGSGQGPAVHDLFESLGYLQVRVGVDYANWPRVVEARKP